MYISDKPIQIEENDTLGRAEFAKQLAKALYEMSLKDSFVVGLYGAWGTGKTSVLNMAEAELKLLSDASLIGKKSQVMRFEPWNYCDSEQLLVQFFEQLISTLSMIDDEGLKTVGEKIQEYSGLLQFTKFIPGIGNLAGLLEIAAKAMGRVISNTAESAGNLSAKKQQISEALVNQHNRVIVMIDDIDRLPDDQIRMVFQLVASVADFPNIAYVLAFDKHIIAKALEDVQKGSGEAFLEKIIQVPFELPEPNQRLVQKVFESQLEPIIEGEKRTDVDIEYRNNVLNKCIFPYIHSLRDVKRILNTTNMKLSIVAAKVNEIDMAAMTTIQVMLPDLYEWIIKNRIYLVGGKHLDEYFDLGFLSKDEQQKLLLDGLELVSGIEKDIVSETLCVLFPNYALLCGFQHEIVSEEELRKQNRVAHPDRFEFYTTLSLESEVIDSVRFDRFLHTLTEAEMMTVIDEVEARGAFDRFVAEVCCHREEIEYERVVLLLSCLTHFVGTYLIQWSYITTELYKLITMLQEDEQEKVLQELIVNATEANFFGVSALFYKYELTNGRISKASDEKTSDDLKASKIEEYYLKQLDHLFPGNSILEADIFNRPFIFGVWSKLPDTSFEEFLRRVRTNDLLLLSFIACFSFSDDLDLGRKKYNGYEVFGINEGEIIRAIRDVCKLPDGQKLSLSVSEVVKAFT